MIAAMEASAPDAERSIAGELAELAREVWGARELLAQLTLRDVRIRYTQAVMGFAWALLTPLLVLGAGSLVRYGMAYMTGTRLESATLLGLSVKALPWSFFVGSIGFAMASLTANLELVTKVAFPRLVLPLSATLTQAFDTAIGAVALGAGIALFAWPGASILWAPLLVALSFLLTCAAAVFLACGNLFFRDVKHIVQVLLTFGIFFTPVFFEPQMLGARAARLLMLNPLSPLLEGLRLCLVQGHDLARPLWIPDARGNPFEVWTPWYLVYATTLSCGAFLASCLWFRRLEHLFAEYV